MQKGELRRRVVRHAEVGDLAGSAQLTEGVGQLRRVHEEIGTMDQEKVDALGAERSERVVDRDTDVFA